MKSWIVGVALLAGCIVDQELSPIGEMDIGPDAAGGGGGGAGGSGGGDAAPARDAGSGGAGGGDAGGGGGVGGGGAGGGGAGGGGAAGGAGGFGGEGFGGEMSTVDAGSAGAGGEGPHCPADQDRCPAACAWYADCGTQLCEGYGNADRPALLEGCLATCANSAALAAVVCLHTRCEETVALGRGASPEFAEGCDGAGGAGGAGDGPNCPPEGDRCPTACGWVADCAVDLCAGYGPADYEPLLVGCTETCAESPALGAIVCAHQTCDQTVTLMRGASPDFQVGCGE